ncbi:MAG: MMPL family transporter, partial [Desulfobacterales bacterium]|nr:MMPL family transporter [Desulfobacterales bacterium]
MKNLNQKLSDFLVDYRWYLFAFLIILTLGSTYFLKNLKIDNSLEIWFLKDDPALMNYNEFKKLYGNDEVVLAWIKPESSVYSPEFVSKIYKITEHIEKNPLVKRVLSITNSPYINGKDGELVVEDMLDKVPDNSYNPELLKQRITSNPLWKKLLFNKGETAIMMMIEPKASSDFDIKRPEVLKYVNDSLSGLNYKLVGMGVTYEELNKISIHDSSLFTSLSYLLLIITIYVLFRRGGLLLASVMTIFFSVLLSLNLFAMCKQSFNMISAIFPTVVIILCLSDAIHIFSHYDDTPVGENRLKRNLYVVLIPCLFTSITNAIGFASLVSSPMAVFKSFGLFSGIGVILAFFVAIIMSSIVIAHKEKKIEVSPENEKFDKYLGIFDKLLVKINSINQKKYKTIVILCSFLFIMGIIGIFGLKIDTYSMNFLLDNNPVKKDSFFIEKDYGFYLPLEVRLKPKGAHGVKSPEFLNKLSSLQETLDKDPDLSKATSIADVVKQLNKVLTDNKESSYKIPDTPEAVAQELLLYELDKENDLSYFVNDNYTEARLTVRIPNISSKVMNTIQERVRTRIEDTFKGDVDIIFGGYIPLYIKMMDYIIQSQISSFALSFIFIFITMGILFRSLTVVFIGIVPNILPIFLTLGFMGAVGINLDIATVTIAAIVMGISVDDTTHFIFMYQEERNKGRSIPKSVEHTLLTSGKAIITTALLLIIGYMVMVFANVKSVIFFGLLISVTMVS